MNFRRARHALLHVVQQARVLAWRSQWRAEVIGRPRLTQPALLLGKGKIIFEERVALGYFPSPHYLTTIAHVEARNPGSEIFFGADTVVNNGLVAIAEHTSIRFGCRVLVGTQVEIFDSDFHGLRIEDRRRSKPDDAAPVIIEDDVFIGSGARILKGVTVGRGAVVATSSVVTRSVPPFAVVAGSPARVVRQLDP